MGRELTRLPRLEERKFWRRRARRLFALRLNCDARRALVVRGRRSKGFFARGERRAATISFFPIIAVSRRLSSRALCLLSLFRNGVTNRFSLWSSASEVLFFPASPGRARTT